MRIDSGMYFLSPFYRLLHDLLTYDTDIVLSVIKDSNTITPNCHKES